MEDSSPKMAPAEMTNASDVNSSAKDFLPAKLEESYVARERSVAEEDEEIKAVKNILSLM